jgi:hypothetical protein
MPRAAARRHAAIRHELRVVGCGKHRGVAAGGRVLPRPPTKRRAVERQSGHARTTTSRLGKRSPYLLYYDPDHDQVFDTEYRRRTRSARGLMSRDARARALLLSSRRPRSQRHAIPLILFSVGLASHHIKATRGAVALLCCFTEANIGALSSTRARIGARGSVCVCVPGVRDTCFARAPRFVWRRDLFAKQTSDRKRNKVERKRLLVFFTTPHVPPPPQTARANEAPKQTPKHRLPPSG